VRGMIFSTVASAFLFAGDAVLAMFLDLKGFLILIINAES
jgi:hypothetical protein